MVSRAVAQSIEKEGARLGQTPFLRASASLKINTLAIPAPVLLAPLSGITDVPFRRLARSFGAGLVFSEMVASGEFVRGTTESLLRAMGDGAGLRAVQLAGRDPQAMHDAAERLAGEGVDIIDINMGCPAKKVTGGLSGSALMREPDLAMSLVEAAVRGAGTVPVTLKMRLGWDRQSMNAADLAARAENLGIHLVTVHGRTRDQFYEGDADWEAIAPVKAAVSIPVIANGDIGDAVSAANAAGASGADGVMIGRAACGRPWIIGLTGGGLAPESLHGVDFADLVIGHYEAMLLHYGSATGVRHARKHLGWYLDRLSRIAGDVFRADRAEILKAAAPETVIRLLRALTGGVSVAEIEFSPPFLQQKAA